MPPETLALLTAAYELWNEEGVAGMLREAWHPEIVYHDPPDFPDPDVTRGAEAVGRHFGERLDALGHAKISLMRAWQVPARPIFLAELSIATGGRSSGVTIPDTPLFHVLRIEDGRTIELWEFMQREHAVAAIEDRA